ncbi:MAG: DUF4281 domain-containing protein [Microvirga sp.]|nr:DUF4281 domain-containing protein [Microvirga sp.]
MDAAIDLDLLFSISTLVAMTGWLALFASLFPRLRALRGLVARAGAPLLLSVFYAVLIAAYFGRGEGGFGSLDEVALLFGDRGVLLAGWIHYLAFDLLIGTELADRAERDGVPALVMPPIFAATFMLGPIGFLAYHLLRPLAARRARGRNDHAIG